MAGDHVADVELGEHLGTDLAGEGAALLEVAVLGAERHGQVVGLDRRLHAAQRGEARMHADLSTLGQRRGPQPRRELRDELHGLEVVLVHLPVRRDQHAPVITHKSALRNGESLRALRPGRSPSSMNSSDAPPPVET